MRRKILITLILISIFALSALVISSCSSGDKTSWNVSAEGSSLTASLIDDGKYGFILRIEGNGKVRDYSSKKDAPWYGKSGRIRSFDISDGITGIGSNAFADCAAESVLLPDSVTELGENVFSEQTQILAYKQVTVADGARVYIYSETQPTTSGYFWHKINGENVLWPVEDNSVTKVLFIGNSFTFYSDIPSLFGSVASAAGKKVLVESVTCGSWTLTKFADASDEYGKQVDDKLRTSDDYDVVVLQEQSTRPLNNYNDFLKAAQNLQSKINQTQQSCRIYLYSTWGYAEEAASRNMTIPEMESKIREAYDTAAQVMGVKVCHVGTAFSSVYTAYPEYNLYYEDNKHPSYTGAFLSACVHAATILNIDPRTSIFTGELDEITAANLKSSAYAVVYG